MKRIQLTKQETGEALSEISGIVTAGGIIAYPTDTIYGLGCDPTSPGALNRIYSNKGRDYEKPLLILIDKAARLKSWCDQVPATAKHLTSHWPAPLTIVLRTRTDLPLELLRGSDSLGFRVPDSPICRAICTACGGAITSTSINRSGEEPVIKPDQIAEQFGDALDALIDAGELAPSPPSTVVRCLGDSSELIRAGAFQLDQLNHQ